MGYSLMSRLIHRLRNWGAIMKSEQITKQALQHIVPLQNSSNEWVWGLEMIKAIIDLVPWCAA